MLKPFRYILLAVFTAFCAGVSAQELPTIQNAAGIHTGKFPNGVSYYLVPNSSSKGYATFALVQKGAGNQDVARAELSSLPRFAKVPPYRFASSKGVGYGRRGYVSYTGGATVFNFEDVPTFDTAALDSTIIMVFDLIDAWKGEQAIIVCGDIDQSRIRDRLQLLSLTVLPRGKSDPAPEYVWNPSSKLQLIRSDVPAGRTASITVKYSSPRTSRKYMHTPQPIVNRMYADELGYILRRRAVQSFYEAGIPLADLRYRYVDSASTDSDETYSFTVYVDTADLEAATAIFASLLADLDVNGASHEEFQDAKARVVSDAVKESSRPVSNRTYVSACIGAYLFGAGMSSAGAVSDFFSGRKITAERDLAMFNRFVAALLDPERNLTLRYAVPESCSLPEGISGRFVSAWKDASAVRESQRYRGHRGDTLGLRYFTGKKVKIKNTSVDPVTGGSLWTFSNGMKVVYRKTSGKEVYYALMVRGGYSSVPGLREGESAFVADMLEICDKGGMRAVDFDNMLSFNGITMRSRVSLSSMVLSGTVPRGGMQLLMRSLLTVAGSRAVNRDAFAYYRRCEALRQEMLQYSTRGINAVMDSLMCPDYFYPDTKTMGKLGDDLPERAGRFFDAQFGRMNDGVLVIMGNLDEDALRKLLCTSLGGFSTGSTWAVRPRVACNFRSGWSTYTVDRSESTVGDGQGCTSLALTAVRPFTIASWCAFRIAAEALRREVVKELATCGQYAEVSTRMQLFPVERVTVFVNCRPCPAEGLPVDVEPSDPLTALGAMREALSKLFAGGISDADLKGYKMAIGHAMAAELALPENLMEAVLTRIADGKDLVTNLQANLAGVTMADVRSVLADLESGSKVEYVIK